MDTEELKQKEVITEELPEHENQKPYALKLPMKYSMAIVAVCIVLGIAFVVSFNNLNTSAQEMRLEKYIGLVTLQNNSQQKELVEGSRLVTQDTIETFVESNAYISLDNTKALKVDQDSQIEIIQVNNNLDIELYKGSLYFNVSEPLIEDETLEFHTNNIVTGVRGTSGVITYAEDVYQSQVVVLSGTVEVMTTEAEPQVVAVRQGEVAVATTLADGTVQVEVNEQEDTPTYLFSTNFLHDLGENIEEYMFEDIEENTIEEDIEEEVEELEEDIEEEVEELEEDIEEEVEELEEGDYIIQWIEPAFETKARVALSKPTGDIWASEAKEITSIYISGAAFSGTPVEVIDDLVHFTNLTYLDLTTHNISDISALSSLTNLTFLKLYNCNISDISAISNLTNLTELDLRMNDISDISAIRNLTNLTELWFDDNNISNISVLSGLTNLTILRLNNNNISDISALRGLTNLTNLQLTYNNISDLSALSELKNLATLHLQSNIDISDWSPVAHVSEVAGRP